MQAKSATGFAAKTTLPTHDDELVWVREHDVAQRRWARTTRPAVV
jgi:hypothetical protein